MMRNAITNAKTVPIIAPVSTALPEESFDCFSGVDEFADDEDIIVGDI